MTDNVRQPVFQAGIKEASIRDNKEKTDPKWSANQDKKCFYCDKIGHVKANCRKKKKRDDEERKTTLAQNSLTSSPVATSPTGLTNVPTSPSGASTSSLRQLTVPSHVSDDKFHSPMWILALKPGSPTDRVMVDSGATHSACPSDHANEHEVREVQHKNSRRPAENSSSIMVRNSSRT